MVATLADIIKQAAEIAAQLAHRDGLRHWLSVHHYVHRWPMRLERWAGEFRMICWIRRFASTREVGQAVKCRQGLLRASAVLDQRERRNQGWNGLDRHCVSSPQGCGQDLVLVSLAKSCPQRQRVLSNESNGTVVGHGLIVIAISPPGCGLGRTWRVVRPSSPALASSGLIKRKHRNHG
jgi:hypothetical protein